MDVFDLSAKITLDSSEYDKALDNSSKKTSRFGSTMAKGLGTAAKVGAGAMTAAGTAVGWMVKKSVDSFADYEQLVGGVETLFKDSAGTVQAYAQIAAQTAGLSANEYMETVTGFSASLLQSLDGDTAKAAKVADMAITDMSDNANKMGTDMASIQNAYQGFAKQNYTMLDNLKLGYGGTKEEMQRLLSDAEAISGIHYDIENYSDVVSAIHVIQDEMGITGTTAKEAGETISGSFAMTKASFQNLLTAFGSGKGVKAAMQNLVNSAKIYVKNLMPVIKTALTGIGEFIGEMGPVIADELPGLISDLLPSLLSAAASLVGSLVKALPGMLSALKDVAGSTMDSLSGWLNEKAPALGSAFDAIRGWVGSAFSAIGEFWDSTAKPALEAFGNFCSETLVPAIQTAWTETIQPAISGAFSAISSFWNDTAQPALSAFWTFCTDTLAPAIQTAWEEVIQPAIENTAGTISAIWEGILQPVFEAIRAFVSDTLAPAVETAWTNTIQPAIETVSTFISDAWTNTILPAWESMNEFIANLGANFETFRSTAETTWESIKTAITTPIEEAKNFIGNMIEEIKGFFNFEFTWPHIPLPHINYTLINVPLLGSIPDPTSLSISWYKKAYDQPYMFSRPTLMGFGDGNGDEMVYGKDSLMDDIRAASGTDNIYTLLQSYLPAILNRPIQLDDGTIVGRYAPQMDMQMGDTRMMARRGLAV